MSKTKKVSRRDMIKTGGVVAAAAAATGLLPDEAEAAKKKKSAKLPRWAMIVDLRRCIGCRGCCIADKAEYGAALGRFNTVVKNVEWGKFPDPKKHFLPRLCNHCAGDESKEWQVPPCVEICPEAKSGERLEMKDGKKKIKYRTGATYKRPDGMILIDASLCIGCYKCVDACPYGVRSPDPNVKLTRADREKDVGVGKCTFCRHRADEGYVTACGNTCQGRARGFGDLNDKKSDAYKLAKEHKLLENRDKSTLLPNEKTNPFVFYIDPDGVLAHYNKKLSKETKFAEFKSSFE